MKIFPFQIGKGSIPPPLALKAVRPRDRGWRGQPPWPGSHSRTRWSWGRWRPGRGPCCRRAPRVTRAPWSWTRWAVIGCCRSRDLMLLCDWSAAGQAEAVRAEQDGPQLLLRRRGHGEGRAGPSVCWSWHCSGAGTRRIHFQIIWHENMMLRLLILNTHDIFHVKDRIVDICIN